METTTIMGMRVIKIPELAGDDFAMVSPDGKAIIWRDGKIIGPVKIGPMLPSQWLEERRKAKEPPQ